MRICILTQPFSLNYGGLLQAFALQKALIRMGHEVTTLRFPPPTYKHPNKYGLYWITFKRLLSKLRGNPYIIRINPESQSKYRYIVSEQIERFININIRYISVDKPLKLGDYSDFDAYLVGSDQVWRPAFSPCLKNFYLDFLGEKKVKRIAYAASFGVDTWEADEITTPILQKLIQRFDKVSVREISAIELCRKYLNITATQQCDPTLLLQKEDYSTLCKEPVPTVTPYIASYILDSNPLIESHIQEFAQSRNLNVQKIGQFNWHTGADSMESWLMGIANAEFVVTDSFHGTVFSLIFQKQFTTILNKDRGTTRITSLLSQLNLTDRISSIETIEEPYDISIDYRCVSQLMGTIRENGLLFLQSI